MGKTRKAALVLLFALTLGLLSYFLYVVLSPSQTKSELCLGINIQIDTLPGVQHFMTDRDVAKELGHMGIRVDSLPLDSIDIHDIESKLRKNPIFASAEVYLSRSSRLIQIRLREQAPLFLAYTKDGAYYISTQQGIIPLNTEYAVYVPIVSGSFSQAFARDTLHSLLTTISQDKYFDHYFSHIYVDPQDGIILTPRIGDTKIYIGRSGNWAQKLHKLRTFNEEVIPRRGWSAFEYIKLSYEGQIVAKARYGEVPREEVDREGEE